MSWPKKLSTWIFPFRSSETNIGEDNDLLRLPHELLLSIVDFLDEADTACLILCSHAFRRRLGDSCWKSFRTESTSLTPDTNFGAPFWKSSPIGSAPNHQRENFLLRLVRDCPRYFFCYTCSRLHPLHYIKPPCSKSGKHYHLRYDSPLKDDEPPPCFSIDYGSKYKFRFYHFQLTMARHRDGPDHGMALDKLPIIEVTRRDYPDRDSVTALLSVEPRIISDELWMRVQQWVVFAPGEILSTRNMRSGIFTPVSSVHCDYTHVSSPACGSRVLAVHETVSPGHEHRPGAVWS